MSQPLRTRSTLSKELAERIRSRIMSGEFAPGARLPSEMDLGREYGISRVMLRYFAQQAMILVGILTIATLLLLTALSIAAGAFAVHGLWLALGSVFVAERIVTVWPGGSRARLLAAAVLPEIAYDMALQAAFLHAVALSLLRRDTAWNHVTAPEAASLVPSR
jgi:hypothetical protein